MKRWLAPVLGIPLLGSMMLCDEVRARDSAGEVKSGVVSWYGKGFHGRKTASGERYNMHEMTCASRHLPFGTLLEVTNPENGKQVVVRVNDRGPFLRSRVLDLSFGAAKKLGFVNSGYILAEIRRLPPDFEIRRQEDEMLDGLAVREGLSADLDSLADTAVQTCLNGKVRKKPECRPFHEMSLGSL